MPISASRRAPNWPWPKTKTLPKIAELNVGISIKPILTSLRRPTTTTADQSDGNTRQWQWSLPNGTPPTQPSHCTLGHPDCVSIVNSLQQQRTTKRSRTTKQNPRRHTIPSSHRRSLRRQRQRNKRYPTYIPHFAEIIKRHESTWLLQQQRFFSHYTSTPSLPPIVTHTSSTTNSNTSTRPINDLSDATTRIGLNADALPWFNYTSLPTLDYTNDATVNRGLFDSIESDDFTTIFGSTDSANPTDDEDPRTPTNVAYVTIPPPPKDTTAVVPIRQLDISTFATQNTQGLRRIPRDTKGKPIPNTTYDYTRYEHLIAMMKTKNLDVYFVQETWLEGDAFDEVIDEYHVFRHNGGKGNHNFRGVAIILSPRYYRGWKDAGSKPPLTTNATSEFAGRYISINIILKKCDRLGKQVCGKKGKQHLALTLASVYHPCTKHGADDIYIKFLDTLDSLLSKIPADNELIMGADVNANISTLDNLHSQEFRTTLGPHGFPKRNAKGEGLLTIYLAHRLQVVNTFFE